MSEPVFTMNGVVARYGFRTVLRELSLSLNRGESLGLLGPNGSGKTTCLRVLLGLVRAHMGKVSVFNQPAGSFHAFERLGFAPEDGTPPEYLTGHEYLTFVASERLIPRPERELRVTELLEYFELPRKGIIRSYSKGMKRKVVLAQAFLGNPDFLILDEPLNGLDPLFIIRLRERIEEYLKGGGSLIYSSHLLSEVEKTCGRIAIIKHGSLLADSTTADLIKRYSSVEGAYREIVQGNSHVVPG